MGRRVYRPESLSRAPHPQFLLSHWTTAEGRPPGELRAELGSVSLRTQPESQPLRSSEGTVQMVQRKHFHVIFSSGRRLVRSSKSRRTDGSAAGCGFAL